MSARAAALLLTALVAPGLVLLPEPAVAADDYHCSQYEPDAQRLPDAESESAPLASMQVPQAHAVLEEKGIEAGQGWTIAVLDSGVVPTGIDVVNDPAGVPTDYHGTVVANLAAGDPRPDGGGLVGIAPGARVVDIPVFKEATDPTQPPAVDAGKLIAGLWTVAREARAADIGVAVVAHWMDHSKELEQAVRAVLAQDVVVVASAGNRPAEGERHYEEVQRIAGPGEDAAGLVFPAGYPGVLGVSATADGSPLVDVRENVLQSSAIDVVVPTFGAVSRGLTGQPCALGIDGDVATSWAAGEVAGVVAMLRSLHRKENRRQIEARLLHTASGTVDRPNVITGAGVVQPLEAVSRPLSPAPDGSIATADQAADVLPATAPEKRSDLLAQPRRRAVWLGLVGGGALVLALVLRPLLTRRRAVDPGR